MDTNSNNNGRQSQEVTFTEVKTGGNFAKFPVWSPKKTENNEQQIFGLLIRKQLDVVTEFGGSPFTIVCPKNPAQGMNETKVYTIWARGAQPAKGVKSTKLYDALSKIKEGEFIIVQYKGQVKTKDGKRMRDDYYVGVANNNFGDLRTQMTDFYSQKLAEAAAEAGTTDGEDGVHEPPF